MDRLISMIIKHCDVKNLASCKTMQYLIDIEYEEMEREDQNAKKRQDTRNE
jgi:hypothetical protein